MKILVFGNPLVEKDSLPLLLLPKLRKEFQNLEFKEIDSTEDLHKEGKDLVILDSAEGIRNVEIVGLDSVKLDKIYSMHDFDLGYNLKLLKKMEMIGDVRIIAVPIGMNPEKALFQTQLILRKCVAQLMQGS